jgi:hypothetical protein
MADKATCQALHLTEVLEQILLHLDMRDLLRCKTVSSHWRQLISDSPALQQHLFLAPAPFRDGQTPRMNPLLAELFPSLFDLKMPRTLSGWDNSGMLSELGWLEDQNAQSKMFHPEASWRSMYPVQPPAKVNSFQFCYEDGCVYKDYGPFYCQIGQAYQHIQQRGLTMGSLFDLVVYLDSLHSVSCFYVHWRMFPLQEDTRAEANNWRDFRKLFRPSTEAAHSLTLYHMHASLCDQRPEDELNITSPLLVQLKEDPRGLIEYLEYQEEELPSSGYTRWPDLVE